MRIRCGYKLDTAVAVAAGFVSDDVPRYCPCCKGGTQSFTHWIMVCPSFNNIRIGRLGNTGKILQILLKIFHSASNPSFNREASFRHIGAARTSTIAIENRYIHNLDRNFISMFTVFEIRTVFYFLFGGKLTSYHEIFSNREWAIMFSCQTK